MLLASKKTIVKQGLKPNLAKMAEMRREELVKRLAYARAKAEEYFAAIEKRNYDFERIEQIRVEAVQAISDAQTYAEIYGWAGATAQPPHEPPNGQEVKAQYELIRMNMGTAGHVLRLS